MRTVENVLKTQLASLSAIVYMWFCGFSSSWYLGWAAFVCIVALSGPSVNYFLYESK